MNIIWSERAIQRVEEAADHISLDSPAAAVRWIEGVLRATERLRHFPESGRTVPLSRKHREIQYRNYRIIYRISRAAIYIVTVRHTKRRLDLTELK